MRKKNSNGEAQSNYELIDLISINGIDFKRNIIYIAGEINSDLPTALYSKYNTLEAYWEAEGLKKPSEINLYVDSYGGDADSINGVFDFYDALLREGVKVNGLAHGKCMSAATLLLGGCTGKRQATKRTRFMVHEIQIFGGGGTHTQTKSAQTELDLLQDTYYGTYAEFSLRGSAKSASKSFEKIKTEWENRCLKETYFSADQAKDWGLIDEVI